MARETKVGLLVGMGVILLIGIILSDHLAVVQQQEPSRQIANFAKEADRGITNGNAGEKLAEFPGGGQNEAAQPTAARRVDPVTLPDEKPEVKENPLPPGGGTPAAGGQIALGGQPVKPDPASGNQGDTSSKPQVQPLAIHVVKQGDTLYRLADIYYKKSSEWTLIKTANPASVGPKGELKLGTKLVIPKEIPAEIMNTGLFEVTKPGVTPGVSEVVLPSGAGSSPGKPTVAAGRFVQVEDGETLTDIAREQLGSGQRWKEILDANKDQIKRPQDLKVGMKLHLPEPTVAKPAAAATLITPPATQPSKVSATFGLAPTAGAPPLVPSLPVSAPATSAKKTYTVQSGDNLETIAAKKLGNRAKWQQIFDANRSQLDSEDDLKVGQTLILPDAPGR